LFPNRQEGLNRSILNRQPFISVEYEKVELAVKKAIQGEPVLNRDALSNPDSLDLYKDLPELQEE